MHNVPELDKLHKANLWSKINACHCLELQFYKLDSLVSLILSCCGLWSAVMARPEKPDQRYTGNGQNN